MKEGWAIKLIFVGNHEIYFYSMKSIFVSNILLCCCVHGEKKGNVGKFGYIFTLPLLHITFCNDNEIVYYSVNCLV